MPASRVERGCGAAGRACEFSPRVPGPGPVTNRRKKKGARRSRHRRVHEVSQRLLGSQLTSATGEAIVLLATGIPAGLEPALMIAGGYA